jgi:hypothetical protein
MASDFVRKTITIRKDQAEYLKSHPEINFSAWVQVNLDRQRRVSENYLI